MKRTNRNKPATGRGRGGVRCRGNDVQCKKLTSSQGVLRSEYGAFKRVTVSNCRSGVKCTESRAKGWGEVGDDLNGAGRVPECIAQFNRVRVRAPFRSFGT